MVLLLIDSLLSLALRSEKWAFQFQFIFLALKFLFARVHINFMHTCLSPPILIPWFKPQRLVPQCLVCSLGFYIGYGCWDNGSVLNWPQSHHSIGWFHYSVTSYPTATESGSHNCAKIWHRVYIHQRKLGWEICNTWVEIKVSSTAQGQALTYWGWGNNFQTVPFSLKNDS